MKKTFALIACVLLVAGLAACNTDKGPADLAIKADESAIQAVADEAGKYVLEQRHAKARPPLPRTSPPRATTGPLAGTDSETRPRSSPPPPPRRRTS
jgi:hypothetical protein